MPEKPIPSPEAAEAHYQKGRTAMEAGDLTAAVEHFRSSIVAVPHFKTFELLGECLLQMERNAEAVTYLAAAAGLGNNQSRALFLLAKALLKTGDRELAADKLRQALTINTGYKSARDLLNSLEPGASQ